MTDKQSKGIRMFDPAFDYGQLPSLTGFLFRKASLRTFAIFGDAVGDRAITPLRYSLLEVVGANPGLQQVQLAGILGLSKPAATLAIDFWQTRDCLSRRPDARDRRSRGIYLTEAGQARLDDLRIIIARQDAQLTEMLSEDELALLKSLMQRVIEGPVL
ncbi:MAG: MarR family transcriptional regulator [Sphingopyxis sp.]|nr:MarR family transcriptional regulator [Sphingopyxis sp.]